jgi:hypothetical protein
MSSVPYSSMTDRGSDRWKSVGGGVALATAALTTVVHAQTPANLANALRPATDPAAQLQTLLNFQDAEYRREFFANTPIAERILMDYGGYFRYGFSEVDDSSSQAQYLNTYDARLYGRVEIDSYARFFGRLRIEYNDWNTIGDFSSSGDGWQVPIGEIYWAEIDLSNWMAAQDGATREWTAKARVGRQYVMWANGLTLADYMYAATADASFGAVALSGLAGITAGHDTIDWDTSRTGYDTNTDRFYLGGKVDCKLGAHVPFAYALAQWDQNAGQTEMLPGGVPADFQVETKFNYESQYWGTGINGALGGDFLYRIEFAVETGTTLSDPIKHDSNLPPDELGRPQKTVPILAQAGLVGLSWLARDSSDARVDFQMLAGSGSVYRLDSGNTYGGIEPGKTDTAFNSLGYVNTGLVLAPEASNMIIPSFTLSFNPFKGIDGLSETRFSGTAFLYTRFDADAPISVPTNFGGSNLVGSEYDFNIDVRIFGDLNTSFRYGVFVPNTPLFTDTESQPRQFIYVGATYAF